MKGIVDETGAIKGADGKRCWKGKRYAGTENGKDKCIPVKNEDELYEEESVLVLYIDGKPSAKYAIGHEAKTAMERLQAKFPNKKFELKREMREAQVGEAKAKPYVKPFIENGKQVGWKSSDGYHVKYWQMFAKDSAIKHAKLNPDEVQEDYTGEFAAEKTPAINPYGGLKDKQHRGAISETPTDNPTGASGEGGWRKYKPKSAGTFKEEQLDEKCWDTHKQVGMKNKGGRQVPNCVPKESAMMKGLRLQK